MRLSPHDWAVEKRNRLKRWERKQSRRPVITQQRRVRGRLRKRAA